jgi:hypothetical protein
MFVVSEAEAATIRAIFHEKGEFSASVELRRLFPDGHSTGAGVHSDNCRLVAVAQWATAGGTARRQDRLTPGGAHKLQHEAEVYGLAGYTDAHASQDGHEIVEFYLIPLSWRHDPSGHPR